MKRLVIIFLLSVCFTTMIYSHCGSCGVGKKERPESQVSNSHHIHSNHIKGTKKKTCGIKCNTYKSDIKKALDLTQSELKQYKTLKKSFHSIVSQKHSIKSSNSSILTSLSEKRLNKNQLRLLEKDYALLRQNTTDLTILETQFLVKLSEVLPKEKLTRYLSLRQKALSCDYCKLF